jgi:hypothetical protein
VLGLHGEIEILRNSALKEQKLNGIDGTADHPEQLSFIIQQWASAVSWLNRYGNLHVPVIVFEADNGADNTLRQARLGAEQIGDWKPKGENLLAHALFSTCIQGKGMQRRVVAFQKNQGNVQVGVDGFYFSKIAVRPDPERRLRLISG